MKGFMIFILMVLLLTFYHVFLEIDNRKNLQLNKLKAENLKLDIQLKRIKLKDF